MLSEARTNDAIEAPVFFEPSPRPAEASGPASIAQPGQQRVDLVGCPWCDNRELVRWGHASDLPRYRCKSWKRSFDALAKTPLANSRMKDKWASLARAMTDGVSTAKAAARCGVHYTTAFRWRHRFLALPAYHLNNGDACHGRLKEWLRGFHGVATKNLANYPGRRALEALGDDASSAHRRR